MKNNDCSVVDFIPHYARVLSIREDAIPSIIEQSKKWTDYPKLQKIPLIVLTAAVIKYYMDTNGLSTDWKTLITTFNVSKVVIENAYNLISNLDNQ